MEERGISKEDGGIAMEAEDIFCEDLTCIAKNRCYSREKKNSKIQNLFQGFNIDNITYMMNMVIEICFN